MRIAGALVLAGLLAGDASAAPDRSFDISKVEALFEKGQRHYDLGEYPDAIEAFKRAYAMMPDPSFLFNLGQAYRQMRDCRDARAAYKAYLRHAPHDDRAKVEKFIADMETCIRAEQDREAARLAALQQPQPPRSKRYRWAGMATAAGGVLAIGGGALFSARALNAEGDLERACREGCATAEVADIDRRGRNASHAATGLYIGGGALVATGVGIALYSLLRYERMVIVPMVQPGAAGVGASVRF